MIESAAGIILRTRPLTETSLIVHWLTPELGRLGTVAKGARRPKSPFAGKLDLFYSAQFTFSRSRHSDLHNLREVNLIETHSAIRHDLDKLQQAAYAAAFIEQTTETEAPLGEISQIMTDFLAWLCAHETLPQYVIALELKLLRELGMEPNLKESSLTPGAMKIAASLQASGWPESVRLKPSRAQGEELDHWLQKFLIYHLDHLPRGRAAALAVGG